MTSTDLLVVGAGSAGLAAAVSAAQAGASVTVVDKADFIGGPYRVNPASLGMFAVESHMQQELHVDLTCDDAFRMLMEHSRWSADGRVVSALIRGTAPTIDWFNDLGVRFDNVIAYYTGGLPVWHIRNEPWNPVIADVLEAKARELGVTFLLETKAERLIVEGDAVRGCVVTRAGASEELRATNTYLACGGYQGSPELIEEYTGLRSGEDLFTFEMFTHPVHQGEGIRMAREAGGAPDHTMLETYIYLPDPYGGPGGTAPELSVFRQPGLLVNQRGLRFVDETIMRNPADAANTVKRQPGRRAYMIVSDQVDERLRTEGLDFQLYGLYHRPGTLEPMKDIVEGAVAEGYPDLFRARDVEELAQVTGMPAEALRQTIEDYDASCRRGLDTQFFKDARYLRELGDGPYNVAKFCLGSYGSSGGITVDEHGRVLDENQVPVPGLYAGGRDANTVYGGTYPFFMAGAISAFSYTMGRLSGIHAAAASAGTRGES